MATSSASQRLPWLPDIVRRFGRATWRLTAYTVGGSIRYRVTGPQKTEILERGGK